MKLRFLGWRMRHGSVVLAALAVVVACGGTEADDDEPPIGPAVIQRYTGVEYDQECADDVIVIDDAVYYPLPKDAEEIDREWYHASVEVEPTSTAVPAPDGAGNGGEPGTLIVFADGVAEFIADSGEISWLSLVEPEDDLTEEFGC